MKIRFYDKHTREFVDSGFYFVMDNEVYSYNENFYESQSISVDFFTFIERCQHIGWCITE